MAASGFGVIAVQFATKLDWMVVDEKWNLDVPIQQSLLLEKYHIDLDVGYSCCGSAMCEESVHHLQVLNHELKCRCLHV